MSRKPAVHSRSKTLFPLIIALSMVCLLAACASGRRSEAVAQAAGASGSDSGAVSGTEPEKGSAESSRETGFITWTFEGARMGLFIPASAGKPLPVAMFLHGCHNDPVREDLWIIAALNAVEPVAVFLPTALPSANSTCSDWGGTYDQTLRQNMKNALAELDRLIAEYSFETSRQYIYGESMGGEGVYRLLADFPARFAGAVSVAGYTVNKNAGSMAHTPLWIYHGSADSISSVTNARTIYQAIRTAGGGYVNFTEYPELEHVPAIQQARQEPGMPIWLLSQKR